MHHLTLPQRRARRGFTIAELLVAMALAGIVGVAGIRLLITNQRAADAQAARIDVQQNLRAAGTIMASELRQLDAADGDIIGMAADTLRVRAMRQVGILCTAPTLGGVLATGVLGTTMTVRTPVYSGSRDFAVNDSLFVFYEGDVYVRTDDSWVRGKVTNVQNVNCADGAPAQQLTVSLFINTAGAPAQLNVNGNIPVGAPVRGFEHVTFRSLQDATTGKWNLVMRSGGTTQILVGPLRGADGVAFTYLDAAGVATAVPANVAQIGLAVREQTARPIWKNGAPAYVQDSLVTRVALRNNPRF